MTRALLAFAFVVAAACSGGGGGDDGPPPVDSNNTVDMPTGPACTGAVYDPCTDNTQCASGNCHLFMQSAFQVCVQACTPGDNTTCPVDKTGANGACNNMGICKPAGPNNCTR